MNSNENVFLTLGAIAIGLILVYFGNQIRRNLHHLQGDDIRPSTRWYHTVSGYCMFYGGIIVVLATIGELLYALCFQSGTVDQ